MPASKRQQPNGANATAPRPQRADARRNVDALLTAAWDVFVTSGVDAPAKEITDRAGVGVGTLYRHFPRRSDLIVAVLKHEIDACAAAGPRLSARLQPWLALIAWIDTLTALLSTKRGLASAMHSGDPAFADLPEYIRGVLDPAVETLLDAARDSGDIHAEISGRDLIITVSLLSQPIPGENPTFNTDMVRIFTEGLREPNRTPRTRKTRPRPRR